MERTTAVQTAQSRRLARYIGYRDRERCSAMCMRGRSDR
jgi:hypothetical protein